VKVGTEAEGENPLARLFNGVKASEMCAVSSPSRRFQLPAREWPMLAADWLIAVSLDGTATEGR